MKSKFGGMDPMEVRALRDDDKNLVLGPNGGVRYEALVDLSGAPGGAGKYGYFTFERSREQDHDVRSVEIYQMSPGTDIKSVSLDHYCPAGCSQAPYSPEVSQLTDSLRAQGNVMAAKPIALSPEDYRDVQAHSLASAPEGTRKFMQEYGGSLESRYENYAASAVRQADSGILLNSNVLPAALKEYKEYGGIQWPEETREQEAGMEVHEPAPPASKPGRRLPDVPTANGGPDKSAQFDCG